jgi:transcriptional regulator with XRE-family HTH domain
MRAMTPGRRADFKKAVGARLRRHREAKRMSQSELAATMTISQANLSMIESGDRMVRLDALWCAARHLGVPITALIPDPLEYAEFVAREMDSVDQSRINDLLTGGGL